MFLVDGEYTLTCGSNKTIKLWNAAKRLLLQTFSGHGGEVIDANSSCDSGQLVTGSVDKTIILWDVTTAQPVRRYRAHIAPVNCVSFNEDASVFLSGSVDGTVKIWDGKSNAREAIQVLDEAKDSISYFEITDHGIVTVSLDQHVRRYDIRRGMMEADCLHGMFALFVSTLPNTNLIYRNKVPLTYVSLTNDGQCFLVSCLNSTLRLLDKATGDILADFRGHLNRKYRIDSGLIANDSIVLTGSEDGTIYGWSILENKIELKIDHAHGCVATLAVHPSRLELICAGENKLYLWTLAEQ